MKEHPGGAGSATWGVSVEVSVGSKENLSEGRKAQARIYLPALPPLKYMVSVSKENNIVYMISFNMHT